jgi:Uma2 family endonuclease
MTAAERAHVAEVLPSEFPRTSPPEGDEHRLPKERALQALGNHYRKLGRGVYLSAELPVYYPGESLFAPDVIAVVDVDPHPRQKWLTALEGRGIDFALEVTVLGDPRKDLEQNVERYARLGVPEYFVLQPLRSRLVGFRLPEGGGAYQPVVPQGGRWPSRVLGLDLALDGGRLRFYHGTAALPEADELIARLEGWIDAIVQREQELALRLEAEEARADAATARADAEAERATAERRRADRLAEKLRTLGVDPDEGQAE